MNLGILTLINPFTLEETLELPPASASGFSGTTYIMNLGISNLINLFTLEETLELPPALAGGLEVTFIINLVISKPYQSIYIKGNS